MTARQPETNPAAYNASREVARGVLWAVLMRWAMRFIGLASTLILARLLSPEDFGVVAMGMLLVHFLFELTDFGASAHLIRAKEADRAQCDTAWTFMLLQRLFTCLALLALARPAAGYFGEPRVVSVMYALALATFIGGFENIGPTLIRRELKFQLDFRFNIYKKLLVFLATVGSALYFRNYWALAIGHLAGTTAGVLLSYVIHPYRPSWSLAAAPEYLRFGLSIIPLRLATTLRETADRFLVGGLGNTSTMGSFSVSRSLATLFTQEIVQPMGRGLFPNYARLASDRAQLSAVYRQVLGLVSFLCIPIGVGMSATAPDMVRVLLGPQWAFAGALIEYLAIGAALYAISHTMNNQILVATGRERAAAVLAWVRVCVTLPILFLGLTQGDVLGLAKATIVAPVVCLPLIYSETRRAVDLPLLALANLWWRPLAGGLAMYVAISMLHPAGLQLAIARLACDVAVGVSAYAGTVLVLWIASGRPEGAERVILKLLGKYPKLLQSRART